jgi:threonine aldolase
VSGSSATALAVDSARGFASDNWSGAHPEVIEAIAGANRGHAPAYGDDPWSERADARFREQFGSEAHAFLVFNGTAANVVALRALTRDYDAVICPETAHMNVDECGAPERIAGVKLLAVATPDGKLNPELAVTQLGRAGDEHASQPRVISISQSSELGTVYAPDEIRGLADFAHEREMLLHVDGARLANAAVHLGLTLGELTTACGADAVSFGGTKNGLLFGDAVVVLRPELAEGLEYLRKQSLQLASKMRFVAAQFEALLAGDLWRRNAAQANAMAAGLAEAVTAAGAPAELAHPVEANEVFVRLPTGAIERLRAELPGELPFHEWPGEENLIRLVCSWDTAEEDVERFGTALAAALGQSSRA